MRAFQRAVARARVCEVPGGALLHAQVLLSVDEVAGRTLLGAAPGDWVQHAPLQTGGLAIAPLVVAVEAARHTRAVAGRNEIVLFAEQAILGLVHPEEAVREHCGGVPARVVGLDGTAGVNAEMLDVEGVAVRVAFRS